MNISSTTNYAEQLTQSTELDPLGLDNFLVHDLSRVNIEQNIEELVATTSLAAEQVLETNFGQDIILAQAALRDIDFLASSLVRMNLCVGHITGLEQAMSQLGAITDTVPRGTVYTYTLQNPVQRERTFTGTDEEHFFIDTVRLSGRLMLEQCEDLLRLDPRIDESETIAATLARTNDSMRYTVEGMVNVSRVVSPNFFSTLMRPFFDNVVIDNVTYAGAGGAQLPLVVIDRLLWGINSSSATYQEYFDDNIRYQPSILRKGLESATTGAFCNSLLKNLHLRQLNGVDMTEALDEARGLMKQIKRFRMPHRKVARDNFKIRPTNSVGSGQYTPSILDVLIDETDRAIDAVSNHSASALTREVTQ